MQNVDLSPLQKAGTEVVQLVRPLFAEHAFLTIICAFFAVLITLRFYRFLKSINSGLVAIIFLLIFGILVLHWTQTRSEPAFLKPAVDMIAPFFPAGATPPPAKPKPVTPVKH